MPVLLFFSYENSFQSRIFDILILGSTLCIFLSVKIVSYIVCKKVAEFDVTIFWSFCFSQLYKQLLNKERLCMNSWLKFVLWYFIHSFLSFFSYKNFEKKGFWTFSFTKKMTQTTCCKKEARKNCIKSILSKLHTTLDINLQLFEKKKTKKTLSLKLVKNLKKKQTNKV